MSIRIFLSASIGALATATAASAQSEAAPDDTGLVVEVGHVDLDEIVVTTSPIARPFGQSIVGATALDGDALAERLDGSIGETLRNEVGISSTYFGAGASRPIIRGLGGDRVRVLDDGLGSFDAAQTSPDHAVPVEPALAERIEIFRGPASLLYGGSAAGGVVNVIGGKIPEEAPEDGIDGAVRYSYSTVNEGNEFAGGFNIGVGNFVLHGEGFYRDADDYDIPGFAGSDAAIAAAEAEEEEHEEEEEGHEHEHEEELVQGPLPNTDLESNGGAGGFSYLFDNGSYNGFFGASVTVLNSNYGIPSSELFVEDEDEEEHDHEDEDHDDDHDDDGHDDDDHEEEEEGHGHGHENVRIDLEQVRYDLKGAINGDLGPFEALKIRVGYGDYRHVELEGDEVGTLFENEEVEGRLELTGKPFAFGGGEVRSAYGVQARHRDFSAEGEEAFTPASTQTLFGLFAFTEYRRGTLLVDFAARYENVENSTDAFVEEEDGPARPVDESFNLFSVAGGAGLQLTDAIFVGVNGFRTERAPSLEEFFSFGPHLATSSFEVGDINLDKEVARGIEGTIRGEFGPFTAAVNGFYTNYQDFIFERETGETLDGLPVFQFSAADTTFRGFEAEVDADLGVIDTSYVGPVKFAAHGQVDYVRATSSGIDDDDQPRIPPLSTLFSLSATSTPVSLRAEVEYVAEQDNVAQFELPTDDFVFVNAYLTLRPFKANRNVAFELRGRNLNNAEGRTHSSFIKDTTPLPGRDIRGSVRVAF